MTRFLITAAVVMLASAAHAADLPRRYEPVPKAPVVYAPNWTGFYIGGHAGYGWGRYKGDLGYNDPAFPGFGAADVFADVTQSADANGFLAGGQIGFNWQAAGSPWVFGIEADGSWSDLKGDFAVTTIAGDPTWNIDTKLDWFGTVRARLGYAVGPYAMIYGTGGFAFGRTSGHISVTYAAPPPTTEIARGDADATHFGWAAGAGAEFMLGRNWSVKAEYLYIDLSEEDLKFVGTQDNAPIVYQTDSWSPALRVHVVRGGLNYRF